VDLSIRDWNRRFPELVRLVNSVPAFTRFRVLLASGRRFHPSHFRETDDRIQDRRAALQSEFSFRNNDT